MEFYEFLDRACGEVLSAEQDGEELDEIVVPPEIFESICLAKKYELRLGLPVSLLGLRVVASDGAAAVAERQIVVG